MPNSFPESRTEMVEEKIISRYIEGGRGLVTLFSSVSGESHTYWFRKPFRDEFDPDIRFVYVQEEKQDSSPTWTYLGMYRPGKFYLTARSPYSRKNKLVKGAEYIVKMSIRHIPYNRMHLYHEGMCCYCGRKLSAHKSLMEGAGRKCLKGPRLDNKR